MSRLSIAAVWAAMCLGTVSGQAQELRTTEWSAYGVSFKAPSDIVVEDDSAEGYVASSPVYYITVELLEGGDWKKEELPGELKAVATDDEVTGQSEVKSFESPQFYGVSLDGGCDTDLCVYSYLLAKDGSCGFYVSVVYKDAGDTVPETILRSFRLED
ncbi:MAG TPA: hypothetical protein H9752_00925 [Candidatus Phocaeicola excrementigallinarum]|nr:hypothetical protein [Candidatus Phocaeicola excrementigallinarum]